MKTIILISMLLVLAAAAPCAALELTSPDFKDGGQLPAVSTCDNPSHTTQPPGLSWTGAPAGTKSFALTCIDPDAPRGEFVHLIIFDIPAKVTALPPGSRSPEGSRVLPNDYGNKGFGVACPPSGTHRYVFTLYALSVEKLSAQSRSDFFDGVKNVQLGSATLTGLYKRK